LIAWVMEELLNEVRQLWFFGIFHNIHDNASIVCNSHHGLFDSTVREASHTAGLAHFSVSKNVWIIHDINKRVFATLLCSFRPFIEHLLYVFYNVHQYITECA
jgi:hypothetical protein